MARIIKAPNIRNERDYPVVEREKVIRMAEDEADEIRSEAQREYDNLIQAAEMQAQEIKAAAEQEMESLRAQAQAEAQEAKEQSRQQGYEEGLKQGQAEARKQVQDIIKDFKGKMTEAQQILEGMFVEQEQEIRALVSHIVGRVIQEKLEADDEIVVRVAKECIRMAADRKTLRILVHPNDQQKIEEWAPEFTRLFDDSEKISIEVDSRVGQGGVIVESGAGGIDGRIEKQIEILDHTLQNP